MRCKICFSIAAEKQAELEKSIVLGSSRLSLQTAVRLNALRRESWNCRPLTPRNRWSKQETSKAEKLGLEMDPGGCGLS